MDWDDYIDLQWFAEDDDDESDGWSLTDSGTNEDGTTWSEYTADDAPDWASDWENYDWDAYNEEHKDEDNTDFSTWSEVDTDDDGNITGWASDFGYEGHTNKDGEWKDDIFSLHNTGKRASDAAGAVAGWLGDKVRSINMALGGNRAGYTSADWERQAEAEKAWNTYDSKVKEEEKNIENFKSRMDPNNPEDQKTLAQFEQEMKDYESRRDSISRDINSTDTGSRIGNMWGNFKEDVGDVVTRGNQFLGGADEYGLGAHGQINDRNGDGKTSLGERALNVGRDVVNWGKDQLENWATGLASGAVAAALGPAGLYMQPGLQAVMGWGIDKGLDAIKGYAATHRGLTAEDKAALAQAELEQQETESSSEDTPTATREPISSTMAQVDKTPTSRWVGGWDTKALSNMAQTNTSYGWNATNDVMGHSTRALSDAHFKDFCVAMMVDNPSLKKALTSRALLNYFKRA